MRSGTLTDMKILITGNSQVACLKAANRIHPEALAATADVAFYCIPGGTGPAFAIENGRLSLNGVRINPELPPFADPPGTPESELASYDAILVSGLGRIGGGFGSPSDMMLRGVLHAYGPRKTDVGAGLLSAACYRRIIASELSAQAGIGFLKRLRAAYAGRILVQSFPRVTAAAAERPDWCLNAIYQDGVGAHRFFSASRDEFLRQLCADLGAELLPYPEQATRPDHMTPPELMPSADGLHPGTDFGRMVLAQAASRLRG